MSFAGFSWFEAVKTFTATYSPFRVPRYTSAHPPYAQGSPGSVTVFASIQYDRGRYLHSWESLEIAENPLECVRISELVLKASDEMTWSAIGIQYQECDLVSLTLSRHSSANSAVTPVKCRISFHWDSLTSDSVNFLTTSSELKSPAANCSALGREDMMPEISSEVAVGRRNRGRYWDIRG